LLYCSAFRHFILFTVSASPTLLPALALMFNALVWGTSWWPFRQLQLLGLHPLWSTVCVYAVAVGTIWVLRPAALMQVLRTPTLWVLLLASGTTNAAFNWAVTIGDVVRVILLFYLMPLWAVLLARLLLNERLTLRAGAQVLLALAGACLVLWPEAAPGEASLATRLPLPRSLADWLGVLGGFTFALNNVMLRREAHRSEESRALAMFIGGVVVAGGLATALTLGGHISGPPEPGWTWLLGAFVLSIFFLFSNFALQFGASRLPANVTAVVMLSEVVFAAGTAVLFGAGSLTLRLVTGGGLIMATALLAIVSKK
jgi:drug/metabolite transporter (DMT)-like permease